MLPNFHLLLSEPHKLILQSFSMLLNEDNNACESDFHNRELPQDLESPCKKQKVQVQPISESLEVDDQSLSDSL